MVKRCFNLTDENYAKISELAKQKGCSMNTIVNQCVQQFSEGKEDMMILQIMKKSQRESENRLNVLYSALNNFFLSFAGTMDDYVSPDKALHRWIEEAEKEEVSRLRQMTTKKKWSGLIDTTL